MGVITLEEAVSTIPDGALLTGANEPVAIGWEIARQRKKRLRIAVTPSAGMWGDLMMGAGCIEKIEFGSMGFGEYGIAPNFRRLGRRTGVKTVDST